MRSMSGGWRFKTVQKFLRDTVQGAANRCFGQFRERDSPIAVPGELGIEWNRSEAGNSQVRDLRRAKGAPRANGAGIMGSPRVSA
jgi:hypothetical protein